LHADLANQANILGIEMDKRNDIDLEKMKQIAASGNDEPLLMLNLNRYIAGEYPKSENYTQWRQVNKQMLDNSEGKLLFILPVRGQRLSNGISEQLDEIIAFWYPSHQSFLDMTKLDLFKRNGELRNQIIDWAAVYRCDPLDLVKLT
tara:strand:+ start:788 stop:1228 length:441 start_codon:yes stop_codon:yes gene_type:complete